MGCITRPATFTSGAVSPKMKMLFLPHFLHDFHVRPIEGSDGQRPIELKFHMLPVPDASVPANEICSLRSAAGIIFSASDTR